jgi:hypothetical protein
MTCLPARALSLFCLCLLPVPFCPAQDNTQSKASKPKDDKNFVPLKDVVTVLESVLNQVQDHLKSENSPLLQSAEFDFQTVTTNDTAGGLIVSIVTAEGEHVKVATRETDFTYSVPSATPHAVNPQFHGFDWLTNLFRNLRKTAKPEDFNATLPAAIIAAADTMNLVRSIDSPGGAKLSQRSFVITISFSVTNSFNGGVDPSSIVTVAPELKYTHSNQNVQTLKLTFADQ